MLDRLGLAGLVIDVDGQVYRTCTLAPFEP